MIQAATSIASLPTASAGGAALMAEKSLPLLLNFPEFRRQLGGLGKTAAYSVVRRHNVRLVHIGGRSMVPLAEAERVISELMANAEPSPMDGRAKTMAARSVASRRKRGAT